jgi:hypothetical protein
MGEHPIFGRFIKALADGRPRAEVEADMGKELFNPALLGVPADGAWVAAAAGTAARVGARSWDAALCASYLDTRPSHLISDGRAAFVPDGLPAATVPIKDWPFIQARTSVVAPAGRQRRTTEAVTVRRRPTAAVTRPAVPTVTPRLPSQHAPSHRTTHASQKYAKMLKVGLPRPSVEHKMASEVRARERARRRWPEGEARWPPRWSQTAAFPLSSSVTTPFSLPPSTMLPPACPDSAVRQPRHPRHGPRVCRARQVADAAAQAPRQGAADAAQEAALGADPGACAKHSQRVGDAGGGGGVLSRNSPPTATTTTIPCHCCC